MVTQPSVSTTPLSFVSSTNWLRVDSISVHPGHDEVSYELQIHIQILKYTTIKSIGVFQK